MLTESNPHGILNAFIVAPSRFHDPDSQTAEVTDTSQIYTLRLDDKGGVAVITTPGADNGRWRVELGCKSFPLICRPV